MRRFDSAEFLSVHVVFVPRNMLSNPNHDKTHRRGNQSPVSVLVVPGITPWMASGRYPLLPTWPTTGLGGVLTLPVAIPGSLAASLVNSRLGTPQWPDLRCPQTAGILNYPPRLQVLPSQALVLPQSLA